MTLSIREGDTASLKSGSKFGHKQRTASCCESVVFYFATNLSATSVRNRLCGVDLYIFFAIVRNQCLWIADAKSFP